MNLVILLPLLVCLIGGLVYYVKVKTVDQLALWAFAMGLLVTLSEFAGRVIHF